MIEVRAKTGEIMQDTEGQRASLKRLLEFATSPTPGHCNFGAMLILSSPGDVSFLAPIAPELRGVEIVSASKADEYDIWKRAGHTPQMLKVDLTAAQVVEWLNSQCQHTEADYLANGKDWLESVFYFYGISKRKEKKRKERL